MGILRNFLLLQNENYTVINPVSFQIDLLKILIIRFRNCDMHKYESSEDDNESTATEETEIAKDNEQINPGDVIFYYHELYGARKEGENCSSAGS